MGISPLAKVTERPIGPKRPSTNTLVKILMGLFGHQVTNPCSMLKIYLVLPGYHTRTDASQRRSVAASQPQSDIICNGS